MPTAVSHDSPAHSSRPFFLVSAVLDNLDARFELIHAKNTHSAALPTSLKHYLVELRRRIDADVETHSNKPDWLAGLKPNGREVAVWTKTLDTWTPSSPAADHTKTKAELVKLFVSSRALSEVLIEVTTPSLPPAVCPPLFTVLLCNSSDGRLPRLGRRYELVCQSEGLDEVQRGRREYLTSCF